MVRIYNNQPYECYGETECVIHDVDDAIRAIYGFDIVMRKIVTLKKKRKKHSQCVYL